MKFLLVLLALAPLLCAEDGLTEAVNGSTTTTIAKIETTHETTTMESTTETTTESTTTELTTEWTTESTTETTAFGHTDVPEVTTLDLEDFVDGFVKDLSKRVGPIVSVILSDENITEECSGALLKVMLGLRSKAPWALFMMDSNGRPAPGTLNGATGSYGDYEECLAVHHQPSNGDAAIYGQYCSLFMTLPLGFARKSAQRMQKDGYFMGRRAPDFFSSDERSYFKGQRLGLCLPELCTIADVRRMIGLTLDPYGFKYHVSGCDSVLNKDRDWNGVRIGMVSLIGVLSFLMLLATGLDIFLKKDSRARDPDSAWKYLMAFAVTINTRKLLNSDFKDGSDNEILGSFAGIKVFSTTWVILGHTYFIVDISALRSYFKVIDATEEPFFTMIGNAFPSIATFFFIGGFLLSFNVLKRMKNLRGHYLAVLWIMLIRRYIRLTLPVMFMVGFGFVLSMVARGPAFYEFLGHNDERCYDSWWRVLLHINNWQSFLNMCSPFYWYISVDWQLYMVFCAVPLIMLRRMKLGVFLLVGSTVATAAYVIFQTYTLDYQPLPLLLSDANQARPSDTVDYVYIKPFTHVGSYCTGILFGYLTLKYEHVKISKVVQWALWCVSTAVALCVIMVPYEWQKGNFPSQLEAGLYAGLHRTAWAVAVGWLIFACVTGRAGVLNKFLSWSFFVPLSRLSLGAYLTSVFILAIRVTYRREIAEYHHFPMVMLFFGTTMLSYMAAYALFLFVECPLGLIEKYIFMSKAMVERHSENNAHTNGAFNGSVEKMTPAEKEKRFVVERF
ncbi:O-acyltransferase like protein [Rhipicephalus microplus]|uniref:O-acyltransferase like protein n=1 Tax=Rhipicephalus microplus TaxID=6941 RepID=UPI003F6B625B